MARRGFGGTALRAALGAVTGVAEGLQQRDVVAAEKKRMADALARQQGLDAMDRARFLMSSGFRVAPEAYSTEDPAARSVLPPLEMPSAAPSSGARAGGALSAALNRGMGVDTTQPSLSRPSFGAAPLAMDSGVSRMTDVFSRAQETRPAQEAIAASVDLPDGMKMRFNAPESAAQIAARTMADYEAKKKADAAIAAQAKADERKALDENARALADVYVSAFVDRNGKPISAAQALAAAKSGKTPLELGFSEKPMSAYESGSLAIAQRNAAVNEGKLRLDQSTQTQTKAQKAATLAAAKKAATDVLPTVIAASNAVSKWGEAEVKSLNPFRIAAQNAAVLEGGWVGAIKSKGLSVTGITDLDKQYLQYASSVADAVARASEVGVLTNQDINRFRSQVSFDGGENETQIRFKLANLKSWASWLANSKKNIDAADGDINTLSSNYGSVAKIPGETDKEYESRTGKSATGANANPYR